jgi:hypothetical protein
MPPVRSIQFLSVQLNTLQYAFYVSSRWSSFLSCLFPCFHVPSIPCLIKFMFVCFLFSMSLRSVFVLLVSASEVNNPQYVFLHLLYSLHRYVRSKIIILYQLYSSVNCKCFYHTFQIRHYRNIPLCL